MLGIVLMQSSNVATYIAQGDVALSVLMTTASTLGAIVMTPLLTKTLAGAYIAVDAKVRPEPVLHLIDISAIALRMHQPRSSVPFSVLTAWQHQLQPCIVCYRV